MFHDQRVLSLLDLKIFIPLSEKICLERRIARDLSSSERPTPSQTTQLMFDSMVKPMYDEFVQPDVNSVTSQILVVPGEQTNHPQLLEKLAKQVEALAIELKN